MPEYFGAPYAQEFIVGLPLEECKVLLQRQNGRQVDQYGVQKSLKIVVEIGEETDHKFEFKLYGHYKRFNFAQFESVWDINKYIYLQGSCEKNGYSTSVHYGFFEHRNKPLPYNLLPIFLYKRFRSISHDQAVFGLTFLMITLFIAAICSF